MIENKVKKAKTRNLIVVFVLWLSLVNISTMIAGKGFENAHESFAGLPFSYFEYFILYLVVFVIYLFGNNRDTVFCKIARYSNLIIAGFPAFLYFTSFPILLGELIMNSDKSLNMVELTWQVTPFFLSIMIAFHDTKITV